MTKLHNLSECQDFPGPANTQDDAANYVKILRLPEQNYMPPDGTAFNEATYINLPAIGAQEVVVEYDVPDGRNGVIFWIANNFVGGGFVDGSGSVIWSFEQDGVPLVGLEHLNTSLGTPAAPSRTSPVRVMEGKKIQLVVKNISILVAGQLVGGRISGHVYPRNTEQQGIFY